MYPSDLPLYVQDEIIELQTHLWSRVAPQSYAIICEAFTEYFCYKDRLHNCKNIIITREKAHKWSTIRVECLSELGLGVQSLLHISTFVIDLMNFSKQMLYSAITTVNKFTITYTVYSSVLL